MTTATLDRPTASTRPSAAPSASSRSLAQLRGRPTAPRVVDGRTMPRGADPTTATSCSYAAAHVRVRHLRGAPTAYVCDLCGTAPGAEWALLDLASPFVVTGTRPGRTRPAVWSTFVFDYGAACRPCHRALDATRRGDS
jgi:hypothetical protein